MARQLGSFEIGAGDRGAPRRQPLRTLPACICGGFLATLLIVVVSLVSPPAPLVPVGRVPDTVSSWRYRVPGPFQNTTTSQLQPSLARRFWDRWMHGLGAFARAQTSSRCMLREVPTAAALLNA